MSGPVYPPVVSALNDFAGLPFWPMGEMRSGGKTKSSSRALGSNIRVTVRVVNDQSTHDRKDKVTG